MNVRTDTGCISLSHPVILQWHFGSGGVTSSFSESWPSTQQRTLHHSRKCCFHSPKHMLGSRQRCLEKHLHFHNHIYHHFPEPMRDGTQRTTTSDTRHKTTTHSSNMTRRQQTPVKHVYVNCFVSITDHFPHENNSTNSWKLTRCASLDLFKGEPPQRMEKPSTLPSQMLVYRPLSASVGLDNAHVVHVHKMLHHTSQTGRSRKPCRWSSQRPPSSNSHFL